MKCEVYAQLHGATQVQRDDVLRINVLGELIRRCRAACLYFRDTAPQRFKLRVDYACIHASRLSRSVRPMSGAKSA